MARTAVRAGPAQNGTEAAAVSVVQGAMEHIGAAVREAAVSPPATAEAAPSAATQTAPPVAAKGQAGRATEVAVAAAVAAADPVAAAREETSAVVVVVEAVAAMGLGARERVTPGVGAPARGGVAEAAALDVGDPAGADKELSPPGWRQHCLMILVFLF